MSTDRVGRARLDELLTSVQPSPAPLSRLREEGVRLRRRRKATLVVGAAAAVAVVAVGGAAGWAALRAPAPEFDPAAAGEFAATGGEVCPKELPTTPGTDGFGTHQAAAAAPNLREPDRVWVCQYLPDLGPFSDELSQRSVAWALQGDAQEVDAADVGAFSEALEGVAPGDRDPEQPCSADLGARWLVVVETAGDLTGFAIDDFGCRDLRLTDDPAVTEPGAASQPGTVPGTFREGAEELLTLTKEHWLECAPTSCTPSS